MMNEEILILLSTYNGEDFLKEQLDSLFSQTYKNISIIVRDDGSEDNTKEILSAYDIHILEGNENLGPIGSYSFLLEYALKNTDAQYFMFCDQDDIWYKNKIYDTFEKMKEMEKVHIDLPILMHTDLEVVDDNLNTLCHSFISYLNLNTHRNSLNYLLMQNNITACTTMLNRKLAQKCIPIPNDSIMHDSWVGLVASEFGQIGYLNKRTIAYRQHTSNTFGAKKYKVSLFFYAIRKNADLFPLQVQAQAFLEVYKKQLSVYTINMLESFLKIESQSFFKKRVTLLKYKLLKQSFIRNIVLLIQI